MWWLGPGPCQAHNNNVERLGVSGSWLCASMAAEAAGWSTASPAGPGKLVSALPSSARQRGLGWERWSPPLYPGLSLPSCSWLTYYHWLVFHIGNEVQEQEMMLLTCGTGTAAQQHHAPSTSCRSQGTPNKSQGGVGNLATGGGGAAVVC